MVCMRTKPFTIFCLRDKEKLEAALLTPGSLHWKVVDPAGAQLQEAEAGGNFLKGGFYLTFNVPQNQRIT